MSYYNRIAGSYDELHGAEQRRKLSIIASRLAPKASDALLDVGCGTGFASQFFSCRYTGIDRASDMISIAKKNHAANNKAVFKVAAAESLPFKDHTFDFVISVTAIHNFDDIKKGLSEMLRVGKPGCSYAFSVLKRSERLDMIKETISSLFRATAVIEEDKDMIFFCASKP